jgi:formate hydrogenlyase subunit 3/multisubunit Na+/H+ antiporter MnhD subunit
VESTKNILSFVPRYTARLLLALVVGIVMGWLLVAINPNLGLFAVLMLLNIGIVGMFGVFYAVQSIRFKESWRWLSYCYLFLVLAGIIWVIIDM